MEGLVQTEERVCVPGKVYISGLNGDVVHQEELPVAQWADGTFMLGPFLVNRNALEAAVAAAKMSRASSHERDDGLTEENIQRVIVPSLIKDDPGVLVVYEPRPWYTPWVKSRIGLQRAADGVLAAEPVYLIEPARLAAGIEGAPIQATRPPRPGWDELAKPNRNARRGGRGRRR